MQESIDVMLTDKKQKQLYAAFLLDLMRMQAMHYCFVNVYE